MRKKVLKMGGGFKVLEKDLISSSNFQLCPFNSSIFLQLNWYKSIFLFFLVSSLREKREIIGF
jgi:hypothetical protein